MFNNLFKKKECIGEHIYDNLGLCLDNEDGKSYDLLMETAYKQTRFRIYYSDGKAKCYVYDDGAIYFAPFRDGTDLAHIGWLDIDQVAELIVKKELPNEDEGDYMSGSMTQILSWHPKINT